MFSHIMLGANDIEQSKQFYDATLDILGHAPGVMDPKGRCFYVTSSGLFAITRPLDGKPASKGNGSTIGFSAKSAEEVEAWHAAGITNGGVSCEDPPGVRHGALGDLYLAYLLDPAGNKICALYRL